MRKFFWESRVPRIAWKLLQDHKLRGGVALPNVELYYDTANLLWIKEWAQLTNRRILNLEGYNLIEGWHVVLIYSNYSKEFKNHLLRRTLLKIWEKYSLRFIQKITLHQQKP